MSHQQFEKLVFLTDSPKAVPLGWTSILEQEVLPPLRADNWDELLDTESVDLVFVFPDQYDLRQPRENEVLRAHPGTTWIAVLEEPDAAKVRSAIQAGYSEVFDVGAAPALVIGPVLRRRERLGKTEQEQKLLEESLSAYQQLTVLDRVRDCLRVLDLAELGRRIVRELSAVLSERDGLVWLPSEDAGSSGLLKALFGDGSQLVNVQQQMSLHALPCAADLLQGKIVQIDWQSQPTVFVPMVEAEVLIALVQLPRKSPRLLNREQTQLRMLRDWLKIALQNCLETEQMRRVLRSRFGDYFSAESFRQHIDKGLLQATRYRRPLTLISLFYAGNDQNRRRVFQYILELLRDADVFEEPQGNSARILLPETGYMGGVQFLRRVSRELTQKFQSNVGRDLLASIASYPWHGADTQQLFSHLDVSLQHVRDKMDILLAMQRNRFDQVLEDLEKLEGVETLDDPNFWADMAFHLVQETTIVEPDSSRMLLFLGSQKESIKTFAPLFDFAARWDRILVSAAIDVDGEMETSGPMNVVRDGNMMSTYLALLERPLGAVAIWCRQSATAGWTGGLCDNVELVRAMFNRFEDQYLLHHKWVS